MLTQKELSKMSCSVPKCTCGGILYLHSKCHPEEPVWCSYHPDGFIIVRCSICEKEIAKIQVAE